MKDIKGFEGLYAVTRDGRVWSYPKKWSQGKHKGKWLKLPVDGRGYYMANFYKKGKGKIVIVHRIVAQTFLQKRKNRSYINHKNGVKTDNRVENLEWCTAQENTLHSIKNKLIKPQRGEKNGMSKLKEKDIKTIRHLFSKGKTQNIIAKRFSVSQSCISLIKMSHAWKHII